MLFGWLKSYTPRGLYGRAALILIVPILTLLVLVSLIFIQRHFENVTRQMTDAIAIDIRYVNDELAKTSGPERQARADELGNALKFTLQVGAARPEAEVSRVWYDVSGRHFITRLRERVGNVRAIDLSDRRRVVVWIGRDGDIVSYQFSRGRISASNPHQFLLLMGFVGVVMTLISFIFLRNQLRPIRRLARAAEAFGRGRVEPYRPTGAAEVRSAGYAFLDMRSRIERQIEQRTMMLSGVSHDLRTPLTRMKLALSMIEDDEAAAALGRDVSEMESLLEAFLAFARDDALDDPVSTDAAGTLREAVARMPDAADRITLELPDQPVMAELRPMAMARALDNLIGNALRYGRNVRVSLRQSGRSLVFCVEDDGPGIPEESREDAVKPFVRLDTARNQDRGSGVGLGLAIAHDIARRHGGMLRLDTSEALGGLRAQIVLPR